MLVPRRAERKERKWREGPGEASRRARSGLVTLSKKASASSIECPIGGKFGGNALIMELNKRYNVSGGRKVLQADKTNANN